MNSLSNIQAIQAASDMEAIKILTSKVDSQAKQITELRRTLDSLLHILKYSSAESDDKEITALREDFRHNWPDA